MFKTIWGLMTTIVVTIAALIVAFAATAEGAPRRELAVLVSAALVLGGCHVLLECRR